MNSLRGLLAAVLILSLAATATAQDMTALPGPARVMQPSGPVPHVATLPTVKPVPLSSPQEGGRLGAPGADSARKPSSLLSTLTMLAALGVVVGLFLLVAWVLKRGLPVGARALPREVVEVLGRVPLSGRQSAHLLRCGNKLVLVSLHATGGADTITEITDPLEVDRLAGLCQSTKPESATQSFRDVLGKLSRQSTPGGFFGLTKGEESASTATSAEDADD